LYIVSTQQMQAAEKAADASGLSYDEMMENAGRAVAEVIETHFKVTGKHILILIGPGNNGGDGLVAARYLAQMDAIVTVYVWKRNTDHDKNWALLDGVDVERVLGSDDFGPARLIHLLAASTIIVDALLGTGVSRPIEGTLAKLLDQTKAAITTRHAPQEESLLDPTHPNVEPEFEPVVVAVDVPSGLNSDTGAADPHTLAADMTVTLASVKWGHILGPGLNVVGRLVVADIGLTPDYYPRDVTLEMATAARVAGMVPPRPVAAHKGTFGTALLVAGSINYSGAAILAGQAAARIGTGLVSMAPPAAIHPIVASCLSEATYWPLPDHDGMLAPGGVRLLNERFTRTQALLVGPGLGLTDSTTGFLKNLLAESGSLPPLILDADALNILAKQEEWWSLLPPDCILTPHPGEMARLTGLTTPSVQANRLELTEKMAAQWQQVVLLKGAHTIVAAPHGRTMVLPFATPALAKAGSGDVLAGMIVGLRAQGAPAFEAAVAGAYLHGLAGQFAGQDLGEAAVVAGDLVEYLPAAIRAVTGRHH
jgi:NAD(P)H-hydrate epimerase